VCFKWFLICFFKWLTWKKLKTCYINRCKIGVESSITLVEVLFGLVQSGFENFDWILGCDWFWILLGYLRFLYVEFYYFFLRTMMDFGFFLRFLKILLL
jgi:hypothetical protein